jgi:hypothetical protein
VGSSCGGWLLGKKGGEIHRVALQLLQEHQKPVIGHPLRVENAVEVVAFMLHDAGVKACHIALDHLAIEPSPAIANPEMPRDDAAQPGD